MVTDKVCADFNSMSYCQLRIYKNWHCFIITLIMCSYVRNGELFQAKCLLLLQYFDVFSTVHHSIELFHQPTLMHNFLYSLTICLFHYYHRHVSSINMPIFRRKNCIHTASGIVALCKRLHSKPVESRLQSSLDLNRCTVQPFTESDDTRCCENTIFPPEDGHVNARNMSRIIV